MDPNIVIKQEPIDPDEVEMMPEPVALDPLIQVKSETVSSPSSSLKSSKHPRKPKSTTKLQKKVKEKRKAPMDPHFGEKEEKMKKIPKTEKESYYEPTRAEVYPDHSMSDFYCAVCDSHMNSVQVWESHIQGKRHLKNLKKELSVTSVKKEKTDDTTDMYYIDTRGAPSPSSNSAGNERRPLSPPESRLRKWYSPEPPSPSAAAVNSSHTSSRNCFDLSNMTTSDKMDYICKLTESIYPQSESDFAEIKSIISAFSQSILQFEIRQLPFAVQQKLAKELFRGK